MFLLEGGDKLIFRPVHLSIRKGFMLSSSYLLNGNSSKHCMLVYHHMEIHILLLQDDETIYECVVALFSSPDLKGHVSYCHHLASVRRPSVRPSVNISIFF
jgi:hypothetical protein